ncbi:MAG: hypothetical protein WAQ05_16935 [Rubrivivax sp.]
MAGSTLQVYVATGESLLWTFGGGFVSLCEPTTLTTYYYVRGQSLSPASWEILADQERMQAASCRIRSTPPSAFASLAGLNVAMYTSTDSGLEATLDAAVLAHSTAVLVDKVRFLAPSTGTCIDTSSPGVAPTYNCTATQLQRPMAGVSEVNDDSIVGMNRFFDQSQSSTSGSFEQPVQQRLYGVAASLPLYRAMQVAQGLPTDDQAQNRPSINTAMVRGYLGGNFVGSKRGWGHLVGGADAKVSSQINICRLRAGSGVQAATNLTFVQYPCNGQAGSLADFTYSDQPDAGIDGIGTSGDIQVVDATVEREVEQCLGTASDRGAYALGTVSLGRFPTDLTAANATHRFLRLDGAAPTRDLAKVGRYAFMTQAFMRWNGGHVATLSAPLQALIKNYPALQRNPDLLAQAGSWSEGMMAPLSTYYGTGPAARQMMTSGIASLPSCTPSTFAAEYPADATLPAPDLQGLTGPSSVMRLLPALKPPPR